MVETKKGAAAAAAAALRAERKEAILSFLESCQRVEKAAEHRYHEKEYFHGSPELTHDMWLRQKAIEIVAGREVRHTAYEFANRLAEATYSNVPDGVTVWAFLSEKRNPFLKAARAELGTADL
ncbi:hypothetical protein [Streptomyces sp. NPDC093269]